MALPEGHEQKVRDFISRHQKLDTCIEPNKPQNKANNLYEFVDTIAKYKAEQEEYSKCKKLVNGFNEEVKHMSSIWSESSINSDGIDYPSKSSDCDVLNEVYDRTNSDFKDTFEYTLKLGYKNYNLSGPCYLLISCDHLSIMNKYERH